VLAHQKNEEEVVRLVKQELRGCSDKEVLAFIRVVDAVADFAKG